MVLFYADNRIQASLRHEKEVKTVWTPHEAVEAINQKKSPDLRGSLGRTWFGYLETEKLAFAAAVWPPLTALAVSW